MTCEAHAERAIAKAPGVLAVDADYKTNKAVVGTAKGQPIPREEILAALESIHYRGKFIDQ